MAVAPTGAIYKSLTFDGEDSRDYGVYITGSAVYNAPEREVEMISIPGRNGQFALDKGRFENIEVTYPAGLFADSETDFADAISEFRNFLCSRKGYVRLQDEYNPNEYRMAIYKSGLEVEPAQLKAGEFEITFDCKPQRYLTSGETAVSVEDGDTLTNPTLFPSNPMLQVKGYGSIGFNGHTIKIDNVLFGTISLLSTKEFFVGNSGEYVFNDEFVNNGDTITATASFDEILATVASSISPTSYTPPTTGDMSISGLGGGTFSIGIKNMTFSFTKGTDYSQTLTAQLTLNYRVGTATDYTSTINCSYQFQYTAASSKISLTGSFSITNSRISTDIRHYRASGSFDTMFADSTMSILGNPTYIDCDIGEVYKSSNGEYISLNPYVDLGTKLPTLATGTNTFTKDITITELKVVPRWWKV